MKDICRICKHKIEVKAEFRAEKLPDPRIVHLKEAHNIDSGVLGDYFVATVQEAVQKPSE
jgi:hypothetical protein